MGYLEQADSTAWMAMYALDLLDMALRLALHDRSYEDVATKFFEHFLAIAGAANNAGLWDDEDAYFYDVLHLADGTDVPIKVKSLVGLVPIGAALAYDQASDVGSCRTSGAGRSGSWPTTRSTGGCSTSGTSTAIATGCWRWCRRDGWSGCWTACSTSPACCRTTASGRSRPGTASTRSASEVGGVDRDGRLRAGRVDHRPVRRQLQLARARSGCR